MDISLPFFNWSFKKALDTEPDNFARARFRIVFTILLFSLLKVVVVAVFAVAGEQWRQTGRALLAFLLYLSILKILLYKPGNIGALTHILLIAGVLLVASNIFIYAHHVNLLTIQFTFMIIVCSFYIQGVKFGIIYSAASILPVMVSLLVHDNSSIYFITTPQELASPGFEIMVVLNFISIIVAHYLFYTAYHDNIKEKEALNIKLQQSVAEANQLAASKSDFLSTMSHELRTPLNSVIGITELLLEDKPEERQKENLKILQFSALDLLSLINNVLDFNKMDSGRQELEKVPFSVAELVQNVCSGLKLKAVDKKLSFILDIDERLKTVNVISDPTRLAQLLYNLVSNAIKFTEKGNVSVKLECRAQTAGKTEVLFSIKDTGIGIHPDRHAAIFESFTQAESHITRKYGGTGLGLAIVKQLLFLFGSAIHMESVLGTGTHFYFTISFPMDVTEENRKKPVAVPKNDFSHLRILIAEDNEVNRLLISKQMDRLGVKPVIVENGEMALKTASTSVFDVIFMDLHMPVLDGYQAIAGIRALPDVQKANTYIVAFTASVTEQEKIFSSGFNDFLHKPVGMADLTAKLEKLTAGPGESDA